MTNTCSQMKCSERSSQGPTVFYLTQELFSAELFFKSPGLIKMGEELQLSSELDWAIESL